MFEQHDLTNETNTIESRLRSIPLAPPRLDRDHLMFLAGQRSVASHHGTRRLWPVLTITSWAACAVVVGLMAAQPPQIVVETRIVERVVEVPAAAPNRSKLPQENLLPLSLKRVTQAPPASDLQRDDFVFNFLDDLGRPLTALASRPSLYQRVTEPTAVASVEPATSGPEPVGSKTYSELRRELLDGGREIVAPSGPLWWF